MNLASAKFWALPAHDASIFANLLNAINSHWMIAFKTRQDNSCDAGIVRAERHHAAPKRSGVRWIVARCHHVLNAKKIGIHLTHSLQRCSSQALSHAALVATRILNVADLVAHHKRQFSRLVFQQFDYGRWNCDDVCSQIGERVYWSGSNDDNLKRWHGIRRNSMLRWILDKTQCHTVAKLDELFVFFARLCANTDRNATQKDSDLHSARHFMPCLVIGQ